MRDSFRVACYDTTRAVFLSRRVEFFYEAWEAVAQKIPPTRNAPGVVRFHDGFRVSLSVCGQPLGLNQMFASIFVPIPSTTALSVNCQ